MASIVDIDHVTKRFTAFEGMFRRSGTAFNAVDDVSVSIEKGRCIGIVGESGSGKTTLANLVADIHQPDDGAIRWHGTDIHALGKEYARYRRNVQMIFQDPYSSLNPRLSIRSTLVDGMKRHITTNKTELADRAEHYLDIVGLPADYLSRYPHEFSGGQRQRISIARALCLDPELIIADEPVSSLDVSVQAQILNLMKRLKEETDTTFALISHDLAVVAFLCEDLVVMNTGKAVEQGVTKEILSNPASDYTKTLINASAMRGIGA